MLFELTEKLPLKAGLPRPLFRPEDVGLRVSFTDPCMDTDWSPNCVGMEETSNSARGKSQGSDTQPEGEPFSIEVAKLTPWYKRDQPGEEKQEVQPERKLSTRNSRSLPQLPQSVSARCYELPI